ncbi:TPA: restriction endonuclease subunit S [Yersinia enterocolitica]|nr:restriction endonuclease subunit S [Yersinia enterocolitica]
MESKRKIYKLIDLVNLRNGAAIKQEYFTDDQFGIDLIKVSNFTKDSIDITGVTKVDIEHARKWVSHRIKANDILIATVGSWPPNWSSVVGKVVRAPTETQGAIQNQNTCSVIPGDLVNQNYLYYLLKTKCFSEWVVNVAQGSANQARVPVKKIGDFLVELPPIDEQVKVSKTLDALDVKITLNRQINQTLEQMAKTLFKSWFVDFDPVVDNALDTGFFEQDLEFPDELLRRAETRKAARESSDFTPLPEDIRQLFPAAFEECAELSLGFSGWVPQGWIAAPLTTVANIVYGKNLPKTKILNEGYPVYGGNGVIGSYSHYLYKKPQVLISCRGAASGKVHWTKPFCFVTNNSLVIEEKNISPLYIYYSLLQQDLTNLTSGSAQPQMTIANLNPVNVLLPKNEIISRFVRHAQDLQTSCEARKIECEVLSTLRDTLLPKLISGELRISDSHIEAADDVLA